MPNNAGRSFTLGRMLICEGDEDVAFFEQLITARKLPKFHMRTTRSERDRRGGNSKFGKVLESLVVASGFESIKHIVIVSDNDDDQLNSFRKICSQVRAANLVPPDAPSERSFGDPTITIVMIPLGRNDGNLECMCLEAAKKSDSQNASLTSTAIEILTTERLSVSRKEKLWLRFNLSIRSVDPFIQLFSVFKDPQHSHLIPLDHNSFDGLAGILEGFRPRLPVKEGLPQSVRAQSARKPARNGTGTRPRPYRKPP